MILIDAIDMPPVTEHDDFISYVQRFQDRGVLGSYYGHGRCGV